ncbi:MAG TPA: hypothetical protein VFH16_15185 [Rubrobacter sp.]|nr:hypothetical protein [Rubrobacter sp.]
MEQSYKQVKHTLGWSDYQLRSDLAMRRHWLLTLDAEHGPQHRRRHR